VLSDVLGRDVQGSVWATDGRLIARSDGFYFPEEKLSPDSSTVLMAGSATELMPVVKVGAAASLPAKPALASPDMIGKASDQVYVNLAMVRSAVTLTSGSNRVAMLVTTLDGVPDNLVATSDAYQDVPPLNLPRFADVPAPRPLIALTSSLNREAEGLSVVLTVLAAAGAAALALGALIARRIVHRGLRPVDALAAASQRLAAGDLS